MLDVIVRILDVGSIIIPCSLWLLYVLALGIYALHLKVLKILIAITTSLDVSIDLRSLDGVCGQVNPFLLALSH
jgi:hypothetical protein